MNQRTCDASDCDRPHYARGLCSRHYGVSYRAGIIPPLDGSGWHRLTAVDIEARTAICSICGPTRIHLHNGARRGHECGTLRAAYVRRRKYQLKQKDLAKIMGAQSGVCAICGDAEALQIDHDHACCSGKRACGRCVRGLLCGRCNTGLRWFLDDPARLQAAARYVLTPPFS